MTQRQNARQSNTWRRRRWSIADPHLRNKVEPCGDCCDVLARHTNSERACSAVLAICPLNHIYIHVPYILTYMQPCICVIERPVRAQAMPEDTAQDMDVGGIDVEKAEQEIAALREMSDNLAVIMCVLHHVALALA